MPKHLPNISIEKYAAYLDGNLPDEEMRQIDAFIENDSDMKAFVEANKDIDAVSNIDLLGNESFDFELDTIELPLVDNDNFLNNEIVGGECDRLEDDLGHFINNTTINDDIMDDTKLEQDTSYDCDIHNEYDDFGVVELSQITIDEITNDELTTPSFDDDL